jgi:signal transduction histidine kinase/DNA-binding response OmpR family regulator/ligand-binding sensor domain-containing protein
MYGQNYTLSYRVLDNEDGLLGGRIISVHQDKQDFVWLSTPQGVGRYDGHQFKWFNSINSNLRGIPQSEHVPIVEDDEGYLWIVSSAGQIDIINTQTLEIQPLEAKNKDFSSFKGNVTDIRASEDNYIFIRTGEKWYLYHSSIGFKSLDISVNLAHKLQFQDGQLWFPDGDNIIAYDYKSNRKTYEIPYQRNTFLRLIHNYHGDRLLFWRFINQDKIEILEFKNNQLEKVSEFKTNNPTKLSLIFVMYLPQRDVIVTNFDVKNQGLTVIDIENEQLIPIKNSTDEALKSVYGKSSDQKGIIWARARKSVVLLNIKKTNFHQYLPNYPLRGLGVFDNHLFAARYKVNLENQEEFNIREKKRTIWSVEQNIKDELWIGESSTIEQLDPKNNSVLKRISSVLKNPIFWTIVRSKEGQWWAGSLNDRGLYTSNFPANDSLFQYEKYNEFEELKELKINHLLEDGAYIWSSTPFGLYLIHKEKGILKKYNSDSPKGFRLPVLHVHFSYKDSDNNYWLATSSEGLIRFKVNTNFEIIDFKRYSVEDGLSSNVLYCIVEDDKERLWISTLNGISCFDKKTESIQVFDKGDGISELEFNRNSYTKSNDGRIYLGSIKGVTAFYPDEVIKSDDYDFPIHITKFSTYKEDDSLIDQTQEVQQTQKILIKPSDRLFRLNVAMLDIYNSKKLRYYYKIEGLFENFQPIDGNTIEIGGLPYGSYTLRVRGQGANKRFSKQELTIPLVVVRPFYLKWWFIFLVFMVVLASIFQVYQWRVIQLEERKKELELLVKERTAQIHKDKTIIEKDKAIIEEQAIQLKELDELKSKFFANISHELRTPLTLILSPLNRYINKKNHANEDYTMLQMMQQNGNKLLKRINELLDLSRLDANRLEVNAQPTFLYPFFKTLLSTFESAANLQGIQLLFKYQLDENIQAKLDDDKVEKIISNFLSNALKFTPKNGEIELNIFKKTDNLLISVRDTGIGILPNDLIKIFDRFYQTTSGKDAAMQRLNGTGIGLSLCRELAKVLKGRVWATSQINQGSIFYLELPLVETFAIKENTQEDETIISVISEKTPISTAQKFRPNVLIVEDNPDLRQFLTIILQEDYNVEAVENGKEAVERLTVDGARYRANNTPMQDRDPQPATHNLQLIISDIMMPVMDGIELLTKVKTTKELQHIPMIMLTARQSLDVKVEALRIGVDDYLTKPFKEEELKARVANLIRNSQNRNTEAKASNSKETQKTISAVDLEWLKTLEQILVENIGISNYKLSEAAAQMTISYRRLQQKLKAITGLTPKQYQRSIKLSKARELLKSGDVATAQEVMYQIGFENYFHFAKMYKEEFGITPGEELK